jgi:hypothetical protein
MNRWAVAAGSSASVTLLGRRGGCEARDSSRARRCVFPATRSASQRRPSLQPSSDGSTWTCREGLPCYNQTNYLSGWSRLRANSQAELSSPVAGISPWPLHLPDGSRS